MAEDRTPFLSSLAHHAADPFRLLVESVVDYAIFMLDPSGLVASWNPGAERIYGYTADEVVGRHFSRFCVDPDKVCELERVAHEGRVLQECERVRKDGSRFWAMVTVTALKDHFGNHIGFAKVTRDITERRQAMEQLRAGEERYRSLVQVSPEAIFVNRGGVITFINDAGLAMLGARSPAEVLGRSPLEFFDAGTHDTIRARIQRLLETGEPAPLMENRLRRLDGCELDVEVTAAAFSEGGVRAIQVVVRDISARRRAEAELTASEERLRLALDGARMGIFDWDIPADRITWSRWHEELWGFAEGEFGGNYASFASRVHPEDLQLVNDRVERCLRDRDRFRHEFRVVWPDGSVHWVEGTGEFAFDADGRPLRMRGVVTETTDRKHAELMLHEKARLAALNAEIALALGHSGDLRVMLQGCAETLAGNLGLEAAGIWTVNRATQALEEMARAGAGPLDSATVDDTARLRTRSLDGPLATLPLLLEDRLVGVLSVRGREAIPASVAAALGAAADAMAVGIERHRAEMLLAAVMDNVIDGIVGIDERGLIQTFNAAAERMFGYAEAEVLGRNVSVLMPEPDASAHDSHLAAYLAGRPPRVVGRDRQVTARKRDGSTFPARLSVSEFVIDGKRHFTGVLRDVTQQLQLEAQLRQSQKMEAVGQLAGGVAHDFNNLLTVITGFTDLLGGDLVEERERLEALAAIRTASARAAGLTRQLLAFSRRTVLQPRVLDLNGVVEESVRLLTRLIGEDITLSAVLAPGLEPVRLDPGQFEQVVLNLAINARDAMPRGGVLTIETSRADLDADYCALHPYASPGRHVVLAVTDTGSGMTPEVRAHIFEPFFTTKEVGHGTGLGLAMVYGIVKQSGGHVEVSSEIEQGTTFRVYLPAATRDEATPPSTAQAPEPRGSETILVVEDDEAVREIAVQALSRYGYRVLDAADGEQALAVAAAHDGPLHVLATDVVMPGRSGRELAEELCRARPGLKVLYVSGYTDDSVLRNGILHAEVAFLQKPFSPLTLATRVRALLDGGSIG